MQDLRQTKEYARYMETLRWKVVSKQQTAGSIQLFVKKIPLLGAVIKIQRPSSVISPQLVDKIAEENKAAAVYIEPLKAAHCKLYAEGGFASARTAFLPSKTIHINLLQSNKELLSQMDKGTRYAIRLAQKRGVKVRESRDIDAFIKLWTHSARSRGMWLPQTKEIRALWQAFGSKAHILLADSFHLYVPAKTVTIAAVLMVRTATTSYYMYAASTKEGNKLSAPSLLVWEAIKLAREKGCKIFDFEGIYDSRYPQTKSWKGFTKFKEGFGGKIITYPETLVKYSNPLVNFFSL